MKLLFKTLLIGLTLLLCLPLLKAQDDASSTDFDEAIVDGKYSSGNIYVLNPTENGRNCVENVIVNGKNYNFNHESNAFEVSLKQYAPNEYIIIQVQYLPGTHPQIINNDCLIHESEFSLPSFVYNKRSKQLEWKIADLDENCTYNVEQMLYGKWIAVKKLGAPNDMISNTFLPVLLSGNNLFRMVQTDQQDQKLASQIVKLKSPNRRILLMTDKVKEAIEFTDVTHYELYDANGFFIKRGTAQKVNVADLKKGEYWINFDGKEAIIMKK